MASSNPKPVVLITGSEGLIGDQLVKSFSGEFEVSSFDIERPNKNPEIGDFIHCDLTKEESVLEALKTLQERRGNRIASVMHLAAYYDFSGEPSPMYDELTVEGTRRLIRGLRESFEVEQFIFSSTLLAMKPSEDDEPLTEKSPLRAEWLYPKSKLQTERVIAEERGDMKAAILRIGGVYDEQGHSLPIAQQIRRIYEKQLESYVFPGDPTTGQAFVHLRDLTDCFRRTVERRNDLDDYEIFLIAEPDVVSYDTLQDLIGDQIHGHDWVTIRIPKTIAKAGAWAMDRFSGGDDQSFIKPWMIDLADDNYPVSMEKARAKLGWQPRYRLRTTLPAIISSLKNDPEAWYRENGFEAPPVEKQKANR